MFKGAKLSKSRGSAVEVPYFLSKYDHSGAIGADEVKQTKMIHRWQSSCAVGLTDTWKCGIKTHYSLKGHLYE